MTFESNAANLSDNESEWKISPTKSTSFKSPILSDNQAGFQKMFLYKYRSSLLKFTPGFGSQFAHGLCQIQTEDLRPLLSRSQFDGNLLDFQHFTLYTKKCIKSILKILRYKSQKIKDESCVNEYNINIVDKFKIFHYINERLVILRIIDKYANKSDFIGFNDKFITAYNSFKIPVTFKDMENVRCDNGITLYSATEIFNNKMYFLRASSINKAQIHELDETGIRLSREIKILAKVKHPNIIRYFTAWVEYQSLYEQLEFCNTGTLDDYIKDYKSKDVRVTNVLGPHSICKSLTNENIVKLLDQMESALTYFHTHFYMTHNRVSTLNIWFRARSGSVIVDILTNLEKPYDCDFVLSSFEYSSDDTPRSIDFVDLAKVAIQCWVGLPNNCINIYLNRMYQYIEDIEGYNETIAQRIKILMQK